jgi:hypothetical protein
MLTRTRTPLQLAAITGSQSLLRSQLYLSPSSPLSQSSPTTLRPNDIDATIRVLVEIGKLDPTTPCASGLSVLHEFTGPARTFKYLLQQQDQFFVDLEPGSASFNGILASRFSLSADESLELMRVLLPAIPPVHDTFGIFYGPYSVTSRGGDSTPPPAYSPPLSEPTAANEPATPKFDEKSSLTLLHAALFRLADHYQRRRPEHVLRSDLAFIYSLLRVGADVHAQTHAGATAWDFVTEFDFEDRRVWVRGRGYYKEIVPDEIWSGCQETTIKGDEDTEQDEGEGVGVGWWGKEDGSSERDKSGLIALWLGVLRYAGINVATYLRRETELHQDGLTMPVYYIRKNIERIFEIEKKEDGQGEYVVRVRDVRISPAGKERGQVAGDDDGLDRCKIPGSWPRTEDEEFSTAKGYTVLEGLRPTADWMVDTADLPKLDLSASDSKQET